MCGIVGYIGHRSSVPVLLNSLKKLEYRGYDSSGICIIDDKKGSIAYRKDQGKISNLEKILETRPLPESHIGISHTRWATHGAPSRKNAHPHYDSSKNIFIVHNGIIENYEALKRDLIKRGYKFVSDTDTEVIAHLIADNNQGDLFKATLKAVKKLKGAFALGIISKQEPHRLIAARIGSPLIIGIGEKENFIASDVPAILESTNKIIYLKDGQLAVLTDQKVDVFDFEGRSVKAKVDKVNFSVDAVRKRGYAHFMLKEIHEQPAVVERMLKDRLKKNKVCLDGLKMPDTELRSMERIFIVACGTAYHAGLVGKYIIEKLTRVPVSIDVSSEFRYRDPIINKKTLIVAISQSGETADTLAAVREARSRGAKVISVCNVLGSSLVRVSDGVLYTHAGPEIGVASTKAYTAQVLMLYLVALKLGAIHNRKALKSAQEIIPFLKELPQLYRRILQPSSLKNIAQIAKMNSHFGCFLFLGRNINFPSALEGALKLKEISYIPAEGYAAGEMKHGPIALIDEYRAVVCITPQAGIYDKMISNMQEIKARKGKIIAIATAGDRDIKAHANHVIYVPETHELLTPLLVALPLQLIAYYISVQRGCDVDQPRNLAKSVTVE